MISKKLSMCINKLSLSPLSSLKKHPSAKNLLDKKEKPIEYKYKNNINSEFSCIQINSPSVNNEDISDKIINKDFSENKTQYKISVSPIETTLFNNNENVYIKKEIIPIKKNDLNLIKNKDKSNIDYFNEFQKKLDEEITFDIVSGKGFSSIEQKLLCFLKN